MFPGLLGREKERVRKAKRANILTVENWCAGRFFLLFFFFYDVLGAREESALTWRATDDFLFGGWRQLCEDFIASLNLLRIDLWTTRSVLALCLAAAFREVLNPSLARFQLGLSLNDVSFADFYLQL